jgi:hypothetical protein
MLFQPCYVASNVRMIVNYELEMISKKNNLVYFKVIPHLPGGTKENHEKSIRIITLLG